MTRRLAGLLAIALCLSLSACDPAPIADPGTVRLVVDVNPDGSATANMFLDSAPSSSAQLRALGRDVGRRLFPSASSLEVEIDSNAGAQPFVVIDVPDLYRPGPQPGVRLDTRDAVGWLLSQGISTADVSLDVPRVPLASQWTPQAADAGDASWDWDAIDSADAAPRGVIRMTPDLWVGAAPLLVAGLTIALLVIALARRRRRRAWATSALAVVTAGCVVDLLLISDGVPTDNLGVAGVLPSSWLDLAATAVLVPWLALPAALALLAHSGAKSADPREGARYTPTVEQTTSQ